MLSVKLANIPSVLWALALGVSAFAGLLGQDNPATLTKGSPPPLVVADYFSNRVLILNKEGQILWSHQAPRPLDVWSLSNGDVLFSYKTGVRLVRPDLSYQEQITQTPSTKDQTRIIWEYTTTSPNETHGCQPLPEGKVLVGLSSPKPRLLEIDSQGKVLIEIPIQSSQTQIHSQMRCVRKSARGTYFVAQNKDEVVREYDSWGNILREIRLPGSNPYVAIPLENGNLLIAGGDGHRFIEMTSDDRIVWEVGQNELKGSPIWFAAGVQRLPNGNTILCNYAAGGHGKTGEQPQLVEVTPEKEIVWALSLFPELKGVTAFQSLAVPGRAEGSEILK